MSKHMNVSFFHEDEIINDEEIPSNSVSSTSFVAPSSTPIKKKNSYKNNPNHPLSNLTLTPDRKSVV